MKKRENCATIRLGFEILWSIHPLTWIKFIPFWLNKGCVSEVNPNFLISNFDTFYLGILAKRIYSRQVWLVWPLYCWKLRITHRSTWWAFFFWRKWWRLDISSAMESFEISKNSYSPIKKLPNILVRFTNDIDNKYFNTFWVYFSNNVSNVMFFSIECLTRLSLTNPMTISEHLGQIKEIIDFFLLVCIFILRQYRYIGHHFILHHFH